jgi:hypothetical protein
MHLKSFYTTHCEVRFFVHLKNDFTKIMFDYFLKGEVYYLS